jgi:hypothetical protein
MFDLGNRYRAKPSTDDPFAYASQMQECNFYYQMIAVQKFAAYVILALRIY